MYLKNSGLLVEWLFVLIDLCFFMSKLEIIIFSLDSECW